MKILLAFGFTSCLAAQAMPSGTIFDIKSGPATTSLKEFATQAHLQLLFDFKAVEKLKTRAVRGQLTPAEALQEMLEGSGFTFHEINDHTIAIARPGGSTSSIESTPERSPSTDGKKEGKTESSLGSLQAQEAPGQGSSPATVEGNAETPPLQGVIVTAEKRSAQLLTVPVPVAALQASDLQNYNQLRIQDYFQKIPGLQIAPSTGGAGGNQQIAVRGIIAGQGLNPTVGVTVDGVPYGSSISNGGGNAIPDIDPSELSRVELLRGPQGTLYGANSLGGQLQYVTVDPSTDGFTGRVQAGASDVQNGVNAGYNARAAVNIPISGDLAVRLSGFTRQDPGYINDVTNGVDGINERKVYGGHLAAIWTPGGDFSLKFSALFQHTEQFGQNFADVLQPATPGQPAPAQDLSQLTVFNRVFNSGVADNRIQTYSLTLHDKIGTFDLTSISSFSQNNEYDTYDSTSFLSVPGFSLNACVFPTLARSFYGTNYNGCYTGAATPPGTGDLNRDRFTVKKYTQELRLTTPLGKYVDWLFGVFYSKELSDFGQDSEVANPATGGTLASLTFFDFPMTDRDEAVFTDFTFKINPKFDVQVGGRANINRQRFVQDEEGGLFMVPGAAGSFEGTPGITLPVDSKFTSYTYLLTPRYFLLQDGRETVMTYARFASGFRPGGPNVGAPVPGVPLTYGPDKTYDYDLGVKADLLDRRLTLDVSLFYIDWRNIQITENLASNSQSAIVNGRRARSQGVELQTELRPLRGLTIDANFTYDDARLRTGLGSIDPTGVASVSPFANVGDRLPFTAQYTGNLDVNQDFPLPFGGGMRGFVGAELSYVGGRPDLFAFTTNATNTGPGFRQDLPAYTQLNARAGVNYNTWTIEVYGTNLADRRGILSGGINEFPPTAFYFITPRTGGFEISETF